MSTCKTTFLQGLFLLSFFYVGQLHADGIIINQADSYLKGDTYYLNAEINYEFSDKALEALAHGVALFINIEIKTKQERKLLWNKTISHSIIAYRIEYQPLSQRYLLIESSSQERQYFHQLNSALTSLGQIKNKPILKLSTVDEKNTYHAMLKAKLDIQSLPASLRPIAFISSKWRLSSSWFKWIVHSTI